MRPLHRPMFRYGGPIKEGVMSGIREPHAGGGRAALVGNPMFPQRGGRALHGEQLSFWPKVVEAGKKTLTSAYKKPVQTILPGKKLKASAGIISNLTGRIPKWWARHKPTAKFRQPSVTQHPGSSFQYVPRPYSKWEIAKNPKLWWRAAKENPKTAVGLGYGAVTDPGQAVITKGIPGALKWSAEALTPGFAEKYLPWDVPGVESAWGKKEDEEKALTANELRIKQLEKLLAGKDGPVVPKKSDAEIRQEQIQKYRDIMDIKGMNKEAAYDSLIAASQAINESGDFKGDLRSGKLINQIVQGASKAFDKPKKTKDAIDTLILKGEIEKDLNKDKNAIMDAYRMKQIELADKQLNESLTEKAIKFAGTMKKPYVDQETAIMTIRDQFDITPNVVLSEKDMEEVKKQDDYKNETDVFTKIVEKQTLGPGYYVMGSSGFVVDEGGNIKQIL